MAVVVLAVKPVVAVSVFSSLIYRADNLFAHCRSLFLAAGLVGGAGGATAKGTHLRHRITFFLNVSVLDSLSQRLLGVRGHLLYVLWV